MVQVFNFEEKQSSFIKLVNVYHKNIKLSFLSNLAVNGMLCVFCTMLH